MFANVIHFSSPVPGTIAIVKHWLPCSVFIFLYFAIFPHFLFFTGYTGVQCDLCVPVCASEWLWFVELQVRSTITNWVNFVATGYRRRLITFHSSTRIVDWPEIKSLVIAFLVSPLTFVWLKGEKHYLHPGLGQVKLLQKVLNVFIKTKVLIFFVNLCVLHLLCHWPQFHDKQPLKFNA